jgi:hypothetical protein
MYKLIVIINNDTYTIIFDTWEQVQDYISCEIKKKNKKVIFRIETDKPFILSFD